MKSNRLLTVVLVFITICNHAYAQQYRLKKIESYKLTPYFPDFQKSDSSTFYYSGNRGGYYTTEYLSQFIQPNIRNFDYLYDANKIILYDSIARRNWEDGRTIPTKYNIVQQFDNLNNVIYYKNTWYTGAFVVTRDSITYSYNGNWLTQSNSKYTGNRSYTYNLSRLLDSIINDNGKPYMTFTYNSNFLLQESTQYNTYGNAVTKTHYYYNSSNKLDSIITQKNNGVGWYDANVKTYTYTTSPSTATETNYYSYVSGGPREIGGSVINFFGARDRLDSVYYQQYNGTTFTNVMRHRYYHNTLVLLDSVITDRWDGVQWANFSDTTGRYSSKHHFTYEPYFPTSIATTENIKIDLAFYPNPATGIIHIDASLPQPAPVSLTIYDTQGKLIRKQEAPAAKELKMQIVVADLPPGMYVLRLDGDNMHGSQQFIIAR